MHISTLTTLTVLASVAQAFAPPSEQFVHNRPDIHHKRDAPKPILMSSNRKVVVSKNSVNLESYTNYYKKVQNEHHKLKLFKLKRHLEEEEELFKRANVISPEVINTPFIVVDENNNRLTKRGAILDMIGDILGNEKESDPVTDSSFWIKEAPPTIHIPAPGLLDQAKYSYRNDYKADFLTVPESDQTVGGIQGVVSNVIQKAASGAVLSSDILSQIFDGLQNDNSKMHKREDQVEIETITLTRFHTEFKYVCSTEVVSCSNTASTKTSDGNGGNGGNGGSSSVATSPASSSLGVSISSATASASASASASGSASASPSSSSFVNSTVSATASRTVATTAVSSSSVTSSAPTPSSTGKYFEADIYAFSLYYFVDAYLGTPGQKNSLLVDTGSADLWVIDTANGGNFNKNESSTWKHLNWDFRNAYQAGQISGEWGMDSITVNGATVDNLVMGVANSSFLTSGDNVKGLLGLGFEGLEGTQQTDIGLYKNYPRRLVDSGLTDVAAYSVWLNSRETGQGNILFGGVDTAKYEGELQTIDMPDVVVGNMKGFLTTHLTNIAINNPNGTVTNLAKDIYAMFDTGAPSTLLPDDVGMAFRDQFNLQYNSAWGLYYGDCNQEGTFTFTLGGKEFTMDVKDFVVDWVTATIPEGQCFFGIGPTRGKMTMFGDTFLRSFYAVFDLDNRQTSLAKTKVDSKESNVIAIPAGGVTKLNLAKREVEAEVKVETVSIPSIATVSIPAF